MNLLNFSFICLCILAALLGGYFYGQQRVQSKALTAQIYFYQRQGKLQSEIQTMSDYQLCLAIGGLRSACRAAFKPSRVHAAPAAPNASGHACAQ